MFVVGEQVKVNGLGFCIVEAINKNTVEVWCGGVRGVRVSKKYVRKLRDSDMVKK